MNLLECLLPCQVEAELATPVAASELVLAPNLVPAFPMDYLQLALNREQSHDLESGYPNDFDCRRQELVPVVLTGSDCPNDFEHQPLAPAQLASPVVRVASLELELVRPSL